MVSVCGNDVSEVVKMLEHVFAVATSLDHRWLQTAEGTRTPGTERPQSQSQLKALFVSKVTTFGTNDECGRSV